MKKARRTDAAQTGNPVCAAFFKQKQERESIMPKIETERLYYFLIKILILIRK